MAPAISPIAGRLVKGGSVFLPVKVQRTGPEGAAKYKEVNNNIKRRMKKAKENWIVEQCSEIEENLRKNNSKRAYELVKDLTTVKQGKMEDTGCKIICGAPTTLAVKRLMMMMMMMMMILHWSSHMIHKHRGGWM